MILKKIAKVMYTTIVVVLALAVVLLTLLRFNVIPRDVFTSRVVEDSKYLDISDDRLLTVMKSNMVDQGVGSVVKDTHEYTLLLSEGIGLRVQLPTSLSVNNILGNSIQSYDHNVAMYVLKGISLSDAVNLLPSKELTQSTPYLFKSKVGSKGAKCLAYEALPGCTVVGLFNNSSDAYATILDTISKESSIAYAEKYRTPVSLQSLPVYAKYKPVLSVNPVDSSTVGFTTKTLTDGFLQYGMSLSKFEDKIFSSLSTLYVLSGGAKEVIVYKTTDSFYAEVGDYVVGIKRLNFNSVEYYLGNGEDARCNITYVLRGGE